MDTQILTLPLFDFADVYHEPMAFPRFVLADDVEKGSTEGSITKESSIVTTIPRVPIKIEVWLWCQEHLQAQMDSDKIKDVFYNTEDRKIAELDLSSAQFEDSADVCHRLAQASGGQWRLRAR